MIYSSLSTQVFHTLEYIYCSHDYYFYLLTLLNERVLSFLLIPSNKSMKVGLTGEKLNIYTSSGSQRVRWGELGSHGRGPLTWYKVSKFLL